MSCLAGTSVTPAGRRASTCCENGIRDGWQRRQSPDHRGLREPHSPVRPGAPGHDGSDQIAVSDLNAATAVANAGNRVLNKAVADINAFSASS